MVMNTVGFFCLGLIIIFIVFVSWTQWGLEVSESCC